METMKVIFLVIGLALAALGVILIYDARKLTKKWFGFNDQNEGSKWFKIGGFIISIIGVPILFFAR